MKIKKSAWRFGQKASVAFWLTLSLFLTWWLATNQQTRDIKLYKYQAPDDAYWIQSYDAYNYVACMRKDILLLSEVESAYISITSEAGMEITANGDPVGAQTLWRPTRNFQNGLTESGQRVTSVDPAIIYNFPREYQWSGHTNKDIILHFDLTPYFKKGKNAIAVDLESRLKQPAFIAWGEIRLKDGEIIPIRTDTSWRAEPVPKGAKQMEWIYPQISALDWAQAQISKRIDQQSFYSTVPKGLYQDPKRTNWIIAEKDQLETEQVFTSKFSLSKEDQEKGSWLSLTSYSPYWIWINGKRLGVTRAKHSGYNGAEWEVGWRGRRPLAALPILMDPDETTDFFGGYRYEDPRHGDPTDNDFKRFENTLNRTRERPNQTADNLVDDRRQPGAPKGRPQDPYGFYEEPIPMVPQLLLRQQVPAKQDAYDISELLKQGENTIKVRLVDSRSGRSDAYTGSQTLRFAVCGESGNTQFHDLDWKRQDGSSAISGQRVTPIQRPLIKFKGGAGKNTPLLPLILIPITLLPFYLLSDSLKWLRNSALVYSFTLLLGLLLQVSFAERSEIISVATGFWSWLYIAMGLLIAVLQYYLPTFKVKRLKGNGSLFIMVALLLLTFCVRVWRVHEQPIDDDEYASIQAVLSIAKEGTPTIAQDIWYSRSPGYHYLAGLFALIFGSNLWVLRIFSILASVLTGWLMWYMAKKYFRNTWTAHITLLLFAVHPFMIFTGHIARFYQQQQLFVLLMLHFFIIGFLHKPNKWFRAFAIFTFFVAVISQEISISFVPIFVILYLMFGRGVPFKWDFKAILYIIFAGINIFADIALFQVKCMTRSVGISPNVEATLSPTFWELGNLFSMFIGYSRLHLVVSAFYFMSLVYCIRRSSPLFLTLHACFITAVISFNFLITSSSFRYMYAIMTLWVLMSAHGITLFGHWISAHLDSRHPNKKTVSLLPWVAVITILLSFSPWRVAQSYDKKILGDPISSLSYVKENLREGDKVMITEPHPHAAKIELGQVDYDLVVPILYDFTYQDLSTGGALRDRNGNALVVNRLAQLQQIFQEQERVWIILNREKFRSRKKNMRWEYPTAREELFIRQNCDLKYGSYLWDVYLWDKNYGTYSKFRTESNNWVE